MQTVPVYGFLLLNNFFMLLAVGPHWTIDDDHSGNVYKNTFVVSWQLETSLTGSFLNLNWLLSRGKINFRFP